MGKIAKVLLFLLAILVFLTQSVLADCPQNACESTTDLQQKINCLQEVTQKCSQQRVDLTSQINYMDNQIKLTTSRITQTEIKIADLAEEIASLSTKIDRLEQSLGRLSDILLSKIVQTYKRGQASFFQLLFSSDGFADFLTRLKYIRIVQVHDKKLMLEIQETKDNYTDQKTLREEKKAEQERLKKQLESQKAQLAQQIKDKQTLLEVTLNDERRYQQFLAQALAEQGAIKKAISDALELLKNGGGDPVSAGSTIALLGNSGAPDCSTGPHLHFSMLKDGNIQNPADFLKNVGVVWENQPDGSFNFSGDWDWPISSPRITQGFGMTYWARLGWYGGNIHDGIDMVSQDSNTIKAPKSGRIIRGSTTCDSSKIPGVSTLKYVAIAHDGGVVTIYLHTQ